MNAQKCLILGAGKLGKRFYQHLHAEQAFNQIWTLSRSPVDFNSYHIALDLLDSDNDPLGALKQLPKFDHLFLIISPSDKTESGYRNTYIKATTKLVATLQASNPNLHTTFISSTSVYDSALLGEINEQTPAEPSRMAGKVLLDAEKELKSICNSLSVVRASGLYSQHRARFLQALEQDDSTGKYFNVIHEQDLCRIVWNTAKHKTELRVTSDGQPFTKKDYQSDVIDSQFTHEEYRRISSLQQQETALIYPSIIEWKKKHYVLGS